MKGGVESKEQETVIKRQKRGRRWSEVWRKRKGRVKEQVGSETEV